jgi:hypothetical protein
MNSESEDVVLAEEASVGGFEDECLAVRVRGVLVCLQIQSHLLIAIDLIDE